MDNNKKEILKFIKNHKNELVLDFFEVVKLIGFDEDEDDYYYVFQKCGGKIYSSSCVGKFYPLKGVIPDIDYEYLERCYKLNTP